MIQKQEVNQNAKSVENESGRSHGPSSSDASINVLSAGVSLSSSFPNASLCHSRPDRGSSNTQFHFYGFLLSRE